MPHDTQVCPCCERPRLDFAFDHGSGIPNICETCLYGPPGHPKRRIVFGPHLEFKMLGTRPPRPKNCACGAPLVGAGWSQWCDACRVLAPRVTKYGLTVPAFRELFKQQGDACATCLRPLTLETARIDHCHDTGVVRGLLCNDCNTGIGFLRDDPDRMRRAADYVEAARTRCG